jgi:glycosyltransferase involved in cell wall biosynthesis
MRIAIYNDWWSPDLVGGAEKTASEMAQHLRISFGESNISVYTLSNSNVTIREIHENLTIVRLGSRTFRSRYSIGFLIKIFEKLRVLFGRATRNLLISEMLSFKPDVILFHNVDRLGVNFASHFRKISTIPIIRIQHDLGDTCINRTRYHKISKKNCVSTCTTCKLKESHFRNQSKSYDLMISVSNFLESTFHRLEFMPRASTYGYPSHKKIEFDSSHFYFNDISTLRLGFVGRVVPEKGIEVVLKSMFLLKTLHNRNATLTVCGAGTERYFKSLRKLASRLDIELNLLGYSDSPFDTLAGKIDAVVIPSIWQEPLGRVPIEGLSRGLPCFVSEIGGLAESKLFLGGPIVYFKPEDENDLMQKMVTSLEFGIPIFKVTGGDKNINSIVENFVKTLLIDQDQTTKVRSNYWVGYHILCRIRRACSRGKNRK